MYVQGTMHIPEINKWYPARKCPGFNRISKWLHKKYIIKYCVNRFVHFNQILQGLFVCLVNYDPNRKTVLLINQKGGYLTLYESQIT